MKARYVVVMVGVLGALTLGVISAFVFRPTYGQPVLVPDLERPMALERAEAARLGMRPARHGVEPVHGGAWQTRLVVHADECVALIVGVTGVSPVETLQLVDRTDMELATIVRGAESHVAQVQWCANVTTNVIAKLWLRDTYDDVVTSVRWELASARRGPGLDERRLTRNASTDQSSGDALDRRDEAAAVARFEARARDLELELVPDATTRSPPARVDARSGLLLPPTRTTFLALERALMTRDASPAIAAYFDPAPDWLSPPSALPEASGEQSAALLRVAGGWERVLAAADLGALGPGCVALTFARIDDPAPGAPVVRVAVPSLARTELTARDGVWSDRACPADGLFLYTIPAAAAAPYEIRVHAVPGAPRARARPRRSPWDGGLLPSAERTALAQTCRAAGAPASEPACVSLAAASDRDGGPAEEVDRLYERACAGGNADACARLSERWLVSIDFERHERAIELERLACDGGVWVSCAHRATRLRSAPDPTDGLAEARRLYGRACTEGRLAAACTNLQQMERWRLGAP